MNLHHLLNARHAAGKPVRVALIGAGKFGSMFLAQVPHTPGLEVATIVDLDPQRAREACRTVGWDSARIETTKFISDGIAAIKDGAIEVVVEATGNPAVGIRHARAAIAPANTSSWSTSRPTCWLDRCSRKRPARPAWCIRWLMVTSRH
jgi:predicted homoserine dehydrogenase-like protein